MLLCGKILTEIVRFLYYFNFTITKEISVSFSKIKTVNVNGNHIIYQISFIKYPLSNMIHRISFVEYQILDTFKLS